MNQNKTWKELLKEKYKYPDPYILSRMKIKDFFNFGNGRPTYEEKKEIVGYLIKKPNNGISETEDNDLTKYIPPKFYTHIDGVERIFTFTELLRWHFEDLFCCKESKNVDAQELNLKKSRNSENNIKTSL